ncbi:MAG: N-acetylornithine carbamoyltransferase [Xanthomonadales bacterium]|nr:N-acetylornithine carbamoyltransferase [Gammaproteobacteria bacterium]MBT8049694.1 N-acetylornithine carbamoyltransferase [Gammaproteobacteria bacterium]MBT8055707.1 N-acetylornithine carbamoyltransferase [Gammaproteobacteria bacterium]NNJ78278.1 N-acetylornithine carbamoyltransferase [Xanthomonadales bacterium]NNL04157.1 N-acetylornithine carbamoyltransferase [Xanthomonadales bacterium]
MPHFLSTIDWSREELDNLLKVAGELKNEPIRNSMKGRSIALLFLNPSMRTRTSFDLGMQQLGGIAIVLQPGKDAWGVEFEPGVIMEGDAEEHIAEVAGVLSRYCDLIGIRAFPQFKDWSVDREDRVIKALARYASVPVINMETIVHPCQEMALMMTLREHLGDVQNRKFLLTWTWHPRPLNTAVANSAALISTKFGMDVTLLCPEEAYRLDAQFEEAATRFASEQGGSFQVTHNIEEAYSGAEIVYAKSWGALPCYGRPDEERMLREKYRHFIVNEEKMAMTDDALFSHCLPLRRNVKATDGVMDADYCVAIDEAENRLHVQKAIMMRLLGTAPRRF